MSTSLQWEAPAAGIRLFLSKATITGSSFAAGCMRNLLPGSAPISLKWFSLYFERQGMTYELLLEIFSMKKLNSSLYRNCSVNFFTVPPELTRVGMLAFFRCTLRSVANHVSVWDRNHAKRGEYVLSVRSAEWPLRSVFVEQCCSCV